MSFDDDSFKILDNLVKHTKETYDFFNMSGNSKNSASSGSTTSSHPPLEMREECAHKNFALENITKICVECGVVIDKDLSYEKEWRYYGMMDTKHSSDPNRCNIRKSEDKSIFKDVEKMGFSDKIVSFANNIYEQVTQSKIFRGNTRKGIIFACIFHAYKCFENPQSCEHLIEIFEINRKIALKGLKFVNLNISKDSPYRGFQINTEHLIKEIMNKFHASEKQIEEVIQIHEFIKDRSVLLNRSRPQSVACGVVRYYTLKKNPEISIDYFRSKINLSELTINKIVKEITRILAN
jgi:transcription initiation factor TFIIIB Brf1 subunit/transcription initiation factor TFIIB